MISINSILSKLELSNKTARLLLHTYTFIILTFIFVPIFVVVLLSFSSAQNPTFPIESLSFKWYYELLEDDALIEGLYNSLLIGSVVGIITITLGTAAALSIVRGTYSSRFINTDTLNTAFIAPITIPWIVTGLSVLVFYNIIGLNGTYTGIIIGHVVISLPFVVLVTSSQLYGFDQSLEEAAMTLGAGKLTVFREVTFPLIKPGLLAGFIFAFAFSFDNFTQTFFWAGVDNQTLPLIIFSRIQFGLTPAVNAIGTIAVVLILLLVIIAELKSGRYN